MSISSQHVTGFFIGLGVAGAGYMLYRKNQDRVDEFLRAKGIDMPAGPGQDAAAMSMEELVRQKERFEDLIAEREYAAAQKGAEEPAGKKAK